MGRSPAKDRDAFIGHDEWVKELQRFESPDGFTTAEYQEMAKVSPNTAGDRIRRGVRMGVLEYVGRKTGRGIDGRVIYSPVYRPAKKGRK